MTFNGSRRFLACMLIATLSIAPNATGDDAIMQTVYREGVPHTDRNGQRLTTYDPDRSYFMLGLWGVPQHGQVWDHTYDWQVYRDAGFNTVWPWHSANIAKALDNGDRFDLQVVWMEHQTAPLNETFIEQVRGIADHDALLATVWDDEPMSRRWGKDEAEAFEQYAAYRTAMSRIAPRLPVFVNLAPWITPPADQRWVQWNRAGDLSCHDNYPVMHRDGAVRSIAAPPQGIAQSVTKAVTSTDQSKPVWFIVGAFERLSRADIAYPFRFPTEMQLRAMIYTAIVHGATGICYFAPDSYICRDAGMIGFSHDARQRYVADAPGQPRPRSYEVTPLLQARAAALWRTAATVNAEIEQLKPALLSPTAPDDETCDIAYRDEQHTGSLRAILKRHPEGGCVLIVVNTTDRVMHVDVTFADAPKNVTLLFGLPNRSLQWEQGASSFSLLFEPFDAHVVRIAHQDDAVRARNSQ